MRVDFSLMAALVAGIITGVYLPDRTGWNCTLVVALKWAQYSALDCHIYNLLFSCVHKTAIGTVLQLSVHTAPYFGLFYSSVHVSCIYRRRSALVAVSPGSR